MSLIQHGVRVALLMATTLGLLWWLTYHSEVTFADGLRYIHQAEQIDQGAWSDGILKAVDHPLHPIAIAAVHEVIGGEGPIAWQRSAQAASILASVLLDHPALPADPGDLRAVDRLARRPPLHGQPDRRVRHRSIVLSESTFLLFWTWGLWAAVRFLREGRFSWLPLTIGFAALAYLARPEGMLLPLALVATLLVLPLHWATRIYWPRWWVAVAFLVVGPLLLAGPYMAAKGGIGTKPSIARLIGTAPKAPPTALEREKPLPADQTTFQTYRYATQRMFRVMRASVTSRCCRSSLLGLIVAWPWSPPGKGLALLGDLARTGGGGPGPAPRHRRLPDDPPRDRARDAPDPGRGQRPGLVDALGRHRGPLDRPGPRAVPARPGRLGRGPGPARRLAARQPRNPRQGVL